MPKYSDAVSDFMARQHLSYFKEPHTVEEAADHFSASYKTMWRYVKSYHDNGHLLLVYRDGNKNVYQVGSEVDAPTVNISGQLFRIDTFLAKAIPAVAKNKRFESKVAKYALFHRSYFVSLYATAVMEARMENGDPGAYLQKLRERLAVYVSVLTQQADEIKKLLDHPTLWDEDTLIEWANNSDPIKGIDNELVDNLKKHRDAIMAGPETEVG